MCRALDQPRGSAAQSDTRSVAVPRERRIRFGLTVVELLLSMAILAIMAGALATLGFSVQQCATYTQAYGTTTQHGRVAIERISRMVSGATAVGVYPGAVVMSTQVGTWTYPDTLLVWHPNGPPANPAGPPLLGELVIYCPNPANPYQLLEVTAPGNTQPVPFNDAGLNVPAWQTTIQNLAQSPSSNIVLLTDLVRAGQLDNVHSRAAVRFACEMHPTEAEWSAYQSGSATFTSLSWPQGLCGSQTGVRQVSIRMELQLLPATAAGQPDASGQLAIPFLGSAALSYTLHQ